VVDREQHLAARTLLDRAFNLLDPNDTSNRHRVLLHRARASASLRNLDEARADVADVLSEVADDAYATRGTALATLGQIEQFEGNFEASSRCLQEAVDLSHAGGDTAGAADALRLWGMTKLMSGDPDGAEEPISASLLTFREIGHRQGEAWALQNLAWIAFVRGEMTEAEERLQESATAFRGVGDRGGLGWAIGLLGYVRYFQGRFEEAGELAESTLVETRESGDRWGLGMMYMLLANVRMFGGRVHEAAQHAQAALELFEAINDTERIGQLHGTLARALVMSGRVDEGLDIMKQHEPFNANFAGLIPASTAVQLGDPALAMEALHNDVGIDPFVGEAIGHGERGVVHGLALLQTGKAADAINVLEQTDRDAHSKGEQAFARAALALAYAAAGQPEQAIATVDSMPALAVGTYIDRMTGALARGFALVQLGRADEAEAALADATALVDPTDDVLDQAVARLGRAIGLEALGRPDAAEMLDDAHARLRAIGTEAKGWETAFRLAGAPFAL
jgi:tetratricopeptide (TPR) repeat protein